MSSLELSAHHFTVESSKLFLKCIYLFKFYLKGRQRAWHGNLAAKSLPGMHWDFT